MPNSVGGDSIVLHKPDDKQKPNTLAAHFVVHQRQIISMLWISLNALGLRQHLAPTVEASAAGGPNCGALLYVAP